jgi:GTP-binding protein
VRPILALVGRPNVGKSTLFNRLIGWRKAIIDAEPRLTRDRLYGLSEWRGRELTVVDTAGLDLPPHPSPLPPGERESGDTAAQTRVAIEEAQVIVFLLDVRQGLTAVDHDIAALLRRSGRPVIVAANKADDPRRAYFEAELMELGFPNPVRLSGQHGIGVDDLLDRVLDLLPATVEPAPIAEDAIARIAIMGRPNVGKSSLLNSLLGDERSLVSELPGTTRDPVDTELFFEGLPVTLIDTAGIWRRRRSQGRLEHYSLLRGIKAMERSDVVLLVLEAPEGVLRQDQHVASYAIEAGKGLVLVVNKVDLAEPSLRTLQHWRQVMAREFKFAPHLPVVLGSARTGEGVKQLLPVALEVAGQRQLRIPTSELNRLIREAFQRRPPPSYKGRRLQFKYATQASGDTPTVVLFVNDVGLMHWSYRRYLENRLRERWPLPGNPLRIILRSARGEQ